MAKVVIDDEDVITSAVIFAAVVAAVAVRCEWIQ